MCLKYLPANKNLLNYLLVNKEWSEILRTKVFKRYLIEDNNYNFVNKIRLKVYTQICHPPFSQQEH